MQNRIVAKNAVRKKFKPRKKIYVSDDVQGVIWQIRIYYKIYTVLPRLYPHFGTELFWGYIRGGIQLRYICVQRHLKHTILLVDKSC